MKNLLEEDYTMNDFTTTTVFSEGKRLFACTICGAWTTVDRGIYAKFASSKHFGVVRVSVCPDCDKKYLKGIIQHLNEVAGAKETPNPKYAENTAIAKKVMGNFDELLKGESE